jgi:hypothetical protein
MKSTPDQPTTGQRLGDFEVVREVGRAVAEVVGGRWRLGVIHCVLTRMKREDVLVRLPDGCTPRYRG